MSDNPFALSNIQRDSEGAARVNDNPFSLANIERDQQAELRGKIKSAVTVNPDQAAEADKLAKRYPVPQDVLARNLLDVKMQAAVEDADAALQTSPKLARALREKPWLAQQSHDDFPALTTVAKAVAQRADRTALGTAGDIGVTALKGAVGLPQAFVGLADIVSGGYAGKGLEAVGLRFEDAQKILDRLYSPAQQQSNEAVKEAEGFIGTLGAMLSNPSTIATTVGESAPQMLGGAAIGKTLIAAAPKLAPWLAAALGEGILGAGSAAEQIRQQTDDGLLSAKQVFAPIASGAGIALFGAVGGRAAQRFGLGDIDTALVARGVDQASAKTLKQGFIAGIAKAGISEGVFEELPQSVQEQLWQNWALDRPLGQGVGAAAAQGLLAGLAMGGGFQAVTDGAARVEAIMAKREQQTAAAEATSENLKTAMKAAASSKLRERNPETFNQLVQFLAESNEGEAPTSVFIDAQVLAQSGVNVAELLPSVADQMEGALASNGTVEVAISDVLTAAPGTPLEQVFLQNARGTPDGLSVNEAKQAGEQADQWKAEADRVMAEAADQQAWAASAETVKTTILDQLNTAGRFKPDVNEAYATLVRDFYAVTASRQGITPEEMYARYPLRVGAQAQTAGPQLDQGSQRFSEDNRLSNLNPNGASWTRIRENNPALQGKGPDDMVTVYRATIGDTIRPDDFVAVDKSTLRTELKNVRARDGKGAKIIEQQVRVRDLLMGNDASEFVYYPAQQLNQPAFDGPETGSTPIGDATTVEVDGKERTVFNSKGQPIHSTLEGVRNFWRWFGDSRVVDDQGRPLVVYHGTAADIEAFDPELTKSPIFGKAVYFAGDAATASGYATGEGANVLPVYLSVSTPTDNPIAFKKEQNFDGVVRTLADGQTIYAVRNPTQIKSATGNSGAFSGQDANILRQDYGTDELTGLPLNPDGTVTVYHHASAANAQAIQRTGQLKAAAEPDVYVTTRKETDTGYGDTAVAIRVNPELLRIDDEFPDGRVDYRIATGKPGGSVKVKVGEYPILNQQARGTFSPSQLVITLNENADLSTFLHESGHFFLEVMADLASQPNAPTDVQADMGALLKWFGIKGDEVVGGADSGAPLAQAAVSEKVQQAEQIIAGIDPEEQAVLYHSGDASIDAQLADGVEPTFGPWLEEVLAGATDDDTMAEDIRNQDPIAFYAEAPTWVARKVAKVLKKPVRQVTVDDIRQHGQLSVVVVDQDDGSIWREQGDGTAEQFTGKARRSYTMSEVPFGVERGDVFTTDAFVPEITLTGDDLIQFLQRNAPGENNLPKTQTLAQDGNLPTDNTQPAGRAPLEVWNAMTLDQKRPYHEKFAESFEQYLLEGKAPNTELQPLFRKFRSWMLNVYKSLTQFMRGRDLQLSDDVRQVFDRMLATDEQIKQAEEAAGLLPNFEATNEAIEKLQARSLRDLKWTVNARNRAIKKLQKEAAALREDVEAEVRAEVQAMPVYAARLSMRGENKLDSAALAEMYMGEGDKYALLDWKPLTDQKLAGKNGVHPDVLADSFGFESGDAMVRAVLAAEPMASVIEGMTDQRMLERHGDLVDQRAIEEAANEAVHNEARAKSLATELKAQSDAMNVRADTGRTNAAGARITVNTITEAAKQFAQNLAARRRVRDLKSAASQHRAAEARAGKRWQEATAAGKTEEAITAKRDQLLNNYTTKALLESQAEVRKIREFFARVTKGSNEKTVERGRDPDVVNAARAILAAHDVAPRLEKSAQDYLDVVRRNDPAMYAALQPSVVGAMQNAKPLGEMTMEELRGLHDEIQAMWHLAKRSRQMEVDGNLMDIEDAEDELQARMQEVGVPDSLPGEASAITSREALGRALQHAGSLLRRVEQWAEGIDGKYGGPFLRLVFQPVKQAADRYRADRIKYRREYQNLVDAVAPHLRKGTIEAPELGYTFGKGRNGIGHAELLHAILHTGNDSNKRKLLLGGRPNLPWATENEDGTLNTGPLPDGRPGWDAFIKRMQDEGVLTKAHYTFAQGVWDLMDSLKGDEKHGAQKTHRDVFGRYFEEVTANEVVTPFGTYRGGYVPAQADPRIVNDANLRALAELENENMAFSFPTTNKGFTKGRTEYNRPLMLDLRTIGQHIDKVLLFTNMEPAVRDVNKLLSQKGVSYSLSRIDPTIYAGMLTPWLSRSARQIVETPIVGDGGISRVLSAARSRAGMALMFANLSNALQQVTGFATAFSKVKADGLRPQMMRATAQFIANPRKMAQAVAKASPFMDQRMANELSNINDAMDKILLDPSLYERSQAWAQKHAYFLQTAFANTMEPIIWTAGYNGALEKGASEAEAARYADGLIRQTQGSTLPEDVSRIETGPAYARMFTQFIGYFNMMANTNATGLKQIAQDAGLKKGAGKALMIVTMGMLVPLWVAEAIAQGMRGGPDDEDKDGYLDDWLAAVFGMGTIKGTLAMVPFVGQAVNAGLSRFNNNPADDKISLSPAVGMLEAMVGLPSQVYQAMQDPDKINARNAVRDVASAISLTTGLPAYALARPLSYLAGVESGKIEPTSPADAVRGAITGTPSPDSKQR